ncbi:MAG: hypothetical protein K6E30_10780 [Lachnospiraceae bacterium]|nr:hypothetical protein [Lachnospiraceae bacterium]
MKDKIMDILVAAAFFAMLLLPLVFSDKEGGKISIEENRYLASAPSSFSYHEGFFEEISNWINDNAGGRELANQFHTWLNYSILNEFRNESAVIVNDWYYALDSENLTLNNLQHKDVMDAEETDRFISRLQNLNNYFEEKNIRFCSMAFPYKVDIYPDNLKDYITQVTPNSEIFLMDSLAELYPELHFKALNGELKDAAAQGQLVCYRSYDGSHWNSQGIFIGYKALMEQIQSVFPEQEIRILDESDFQIRIIERTNKVLNHVFSEEDVAYSLTDPKAVNNDNWFNTINYANNDPWKSCRCYETGDYSRPDILIIGDSYIWMQMFPWIAESFNKSVFIHQFDEDNLQRIIDRVHPDVVVFAGLTTTIEDLIRFSDITIERGAIRKMFF